MRAGLTVLALGLTGCLAVPASATDPSAQYFDNLAGLCDGQAYAGRLVSEDEVDADFREARMIMGPAVCTGQVIHIPFAVGEDRSRTWQITRTLQGIRLKHDHRHRDGTEDVLTQYGGDSQGAGSAAHQDFPADEETKVLFMREGIEVSTQNTWRVEILPGDLFAYQMSRPERLFRVEFDLSVPVVAPPPPWSEVAVE